MYQPWSLNDYANFNKCSNKFTICYRYKDFLKILSLWAAVPALSGKVVSTDGFNIEAFTQPRGIICIELIEKLPLTDCVYAITASIAFGNCVLVSTPADLYQDLIQWSQCCKFPEGVVNIFKQCSPDSVTSIEHTSISLSLVKFTLWSFRQDLNTNSEFTKLFSKLVFSSELNCLQIKHVQKMNVPQIERISTRPKFVWFPNQ